MDNSFWKKINAETVAGFIFIAKIGIVFLIKKWVEKFSDTVFAALKKHKGSMLIPALILVVWFPISSVIEAYFLKHDGIRGLWTIVVDLYMTYFLWILLRVFFKRVKAERELVK